MRTKTIAAIAVLAVLTLGALIGALPLAPSGGTARLHVAGVEPTHGSSPAAAALARAAPDVAVHASSGANLTFPRTVLVETFSAVWCHYCPAETQALFYLDQRVSHATLDIAELHECAFAPGAGPCLDNFVPPDNTSYLRGDFYNVCGLPNVFFDGQNNICGDIGSEEVTENAYESEIANASMWPGNVSIAQSASISSTEVSDHLAIDSGLTGSYNVITYLMEYIDKQNVSEGYGPHDVGNVVRETLRNHPLDLVAGQTTDLNVSGPLNASWNALNLSVISFVQDNATKIVENTNYAPVTTLVSTVAASPSTIYSTNSSDLTITVTNSSSGMPLAGATVNLSSPQGGSFSPSGGMTNSEGVFQSSFTPAKVTEEVTYNVTAQVSAANFTGGNFTTAINVLPVSPPSAATGVVITPGQSSAIQLSWLPPASGGSGVTYHIFRATSPTGPYASIGTTTKTNFLDFQTTFGTPYWYKVAAANGGGFAPNTTAAPASPATVVTSGLPFGVGWWLNLDGTSFNSSTNASLTAYVPSGVVAYAFGPGSYGFLAPVPSSSFVAAPGLPVRVQANFTARLAQLQGTVDPSGASITVDGAAVAVSGGSYLDTLAAGTYSLVVSATGYKTNDTSVTLTPGNTTTLNFVLSANSGGSSATTNGGGGISPMIEYAVIAGALVVVIPAVIAGYVISRRRRNGPG